jgi:hypothetical protein
MPEPAQVETTSRTLALVWAAEEVHPTEEHPEEDSSR